MLNSRADRAPATVPSSFGDIAEDAVVRRRIDAARWTSAAGNDRRDSGRRGSRAPSPGPLTFSAGMRSWSLRATAVLVTTAIGFSAPATAAAADAGPVGWPDVPQLISDRAEQTLDPDYWTNYVRELLIGGTIIAPIPIDPVKPEAVLPTMRVDDGAYVADLPREDVDLRDVTYDWRGTTKTVEQFVRTTESDGIAFVSNGALVADDYTNGWSAELRHQPWSVTKSFVSTLVGIAVDEGHVASVGDPIDDYIGELSGTAWDGVTIENILQMESGVHWDESTPVLPANTQVQQWVAMALDLHTDGVLGQTRNEFLKSLPKTYEQGTEFRYNSGNTQVLAWLLETVYDQPFHEVLSTKLWQPAGMADDALVMTDRVGDAVASQGLYSRMHDLARFGELIRNDGRTPDGDQVVSAEWIAEATAMTDVSDGTYGYQWWRGATEDAFTASGFQGQFIGVSPDNCLTGVRLAHTLGIDTEGEVNSGEQEWNAVYRAVADHLGGCDG